jgi:DNA-binding GntR family transcriptional regulator
VFRGFTVEFGVDRMHVGHRQPVPAAGRQQVAEVERTDHDHDENVRPGRFETRVADLTPGILDAPEEGSLWAVLRARYKIRLARSTAVPESIVLDDASSSQLAVRAGSAGTPLTRRIEDDAGRGVEYA